MRAWIAAQKPGSTVKISFPSLDFYLSTSLRPLAIAIDDETGHARSGGKKYRTRSRKKVSGRRFKTRSVGLVEAETFFCLAQRESFRKLVSGWRVCVLLEFAKV